MTERKTINPEDITLAVVREWAELLDPENTAGLAGHARHCPVAKCIKTAVGTDEKVVADSESFSIGGEEYITPEDVGLLVKLIDGARDPRDPGDPVRVNEVLAYIEMVENRNDRVVRKEQE